MRHSASAVLVASLLLASCSEQASEPAPSAPSSPTDEAASQEQDLGVLQQNDVEMPIRDVVAIWDSGQRELTVILLPFKATEEEREKATEWGGGSSVAFDRRRSSPDPAKWEWCPYGELSLRFDRSGTETTIEAIQHYFVLMWGIEQRNQTVNRTLMTDDIPNAVQELELSVSEGTGTLRLAAKGEHSDSFAKVTWDINATTSVSIE